MENLEKVYTVCCIYHTEASQLLTELKGSRTFGYWHKTAEQECAARYGTDKDWQISTLLIKPVQRLFKYPLLLRGSSISLISR